MDREQQQGLRDTVSPVFIWAPTQRCGTGLLQRLVTSSKEALIFSEESHLTLQIPKQLIQCSRRAQRNDTLLNRLASGDPSGWYVHAYPPSGTYREALVCNFYTLVEMFSRSAQALGFGRWGTKYPGIHIQEILILAELLPGARHLVVYRDIYDVLRSVKSRGWLESTSNTIAYCQHWTERLSMALKHLSPDPRFHLIEYSQLVSDPATHASEIASFLSLARVDMDVFSHRPNAPGDGYRPPSALTADDLAIMHQLCGDLRSHLGYPQKIAA